MPILRRIVPVLLAVALARTSLDAQSRLPSEPRVAPAPAVIDTGFATWRASRTARIDYVSLASAGVQIIILPLSAQPAAVRAEGIRTALSSCASAHGHSAEVVTRAGSEDPWAAFDAAAAQLPSLVISLVPVPEAGTAPCRNGVAPWAGSAEGVVSVRDGATAPGGIIDMEVQVNQFPILPVVVGAVPTRLVRGDAIVNGPHQSRGYYAIDKFAPRADGSFPSVEIRMLRGGSADALLVVVPDSLLGRIWAAQNQWRAVRVNDHRADAPLPMPVARDAELRRARSLWLSGAGDSALLAGISRITDGQPLSIEDRTIGQAWIGLEAALAGDTVTGRALLSQALASAPCLSLPSTASNDAHQWIENARPVRSCDVRPVRDALVAGLIPGRTLWSHPEPKTWLGRAVLGVSVTTLALGVYNRTRATALYDDYQSETLDPGGVYASAEDHRTKANAMLLTAGVTWIGSALIGAALEWRRAARISDERDFGGKETTRFGPVENPSAPEGR